MVLGDMDEVHRLVVSSIRLCPNAELASGCSVIHRLHSLLQMVVGLTAGDRIQLAAMVLETLEPADRELARIQADAPNPTHRVDDLVSRVRSRG